MTTSIPPSWNQIHRLRKDAEDERDGRPRRPHFTSSAYRLTGDFDPERLIRAWERVERRHPVLRSSFSLEPPGWNVDPPTAHSAPVVLRAPDAETAARALAEEAARPFDLAAGPLGRVVLVEESGGAWWVAVVVEHLVSDAWSMQILVRDLARAYRADAELEGPAGTAFPAWSQEQHAWLESPAGRGALRRVCESLAGVGPYPEMPIDGSTRRPDVDHSRTDSFEVELSGAARTALAEAARRERMSPLNLVHAALHAALARATGLGWSATTLTTANRFDPALVETVGWLVNKVVVLVRPQRPGEREALDAFRAASLSALDTSAVPWTALVAELVPESFGRHATVPYVSFNAIPSSIAGRFEDFELPGVEVEPRGLRLGWWDAGIANLVGEDRDGIRVHCQFKTDWFARPTVVSLWEDALETLSRWTGIRSAVPAEVGGPGT